MRGRRHNAADYATMHACLMSGHRVSNCPFKMLLGSKVKPWAARNMVLFYAQEYWVKMLGNAGNV